MDSVDWWLGSTCCRPKMQYNSWMLETTNGYQMLEVWSSLRTRRSGSKDAIRITRFIRPSCTKRAKCIALESSQRVCQKTFRLLLFVSLCDRRLITFMSFYSNWWFHKMMNMIVWYVTREIFWFCSSLFIPIPKRVLPSQILIPFLMCPSLSDSNSFLICSLAAIPLYCFLSIMHNAVNYNSIRFWYPC